MKQNGFTLIELLIVVLLIGTLSSILVAVIDPGKQEEKAYDGVRLSNLNALSEAIETYRLSEGSYPSNGDESNSTSLLRTVYLKDWPNDQTYTYKYSTSAGGVVLLINNAKGGCYKYQSTWSQIRDCPTTVCDTSETADPKDCKDL